MATLMLTFRIPCFPPNVLLNKIPKTSMSLIQLEDLTEYFRRVGQMFYLVHSEQEPNVLVSKINLQIWLEDSSFLDRNWNHTAYYHHGPEPPSEKIVVHYSSSLCWIKWMIFCVKCNIASEK